MDRSSQHVSCICNPTPASSPRSHSLQNRGRSAQRKYSRIQLGLCHGYLFVILKLGVSGLTQDSSCWRFSSYIHQKLRLINTNLICRRRSTIPPNLLCDPDLQQGENISSLERQQAGHIKQNMYTNGNQRERERSRDRSQGNAASRMIDCSTYEM